MTKTRVELLTSFVEDSGLEVDEATTNLLLNRALKLLFTLTFLVECMLLVSQTFSLTLLSSPEETQRFKTDQNA